MNQGCERLLKQEGKHAKVTVANITSETSVYALPLPLPFIHVSDVHMFTNINLH